MVYGISGERKTFLIQSIKISLLRTYLLSVGFPVIWRKRRRERPSRVGMEEEGEKGRKYTVGNCV